MSRITPRPRVATAILVALLSSSCDSPTENRPRAITVAIARSSLTLGQGATDSVDINVARSNFDKPVTLTVSGVPAGATFEVSPNPVPPGVTRSRLQIWAPGNAIPGTSTITVRAEGDGVTPQAATMSFTITVTGSYSLGAVNPVVTVAQGGGGSTIVAVARSGGFSADVALTVSGGPAGLTATLEPTGSNTSTKLRLSAAASLAPGTHTLTISGSSPGLTDRTTTVTVRVIPPPSTASITFNFCEPFVPAWFAYQNEGYEWQRVTGQGNGFTFDATGKLGLAWAFDFDGVFEIVVHYTARDEHLPVNNPAVCTGSKVVTGTVAGLPSGEEALIAMGWSWANASADAPGYTLPSVASGPLDLVASRDPLDEGGDGWNFDFIPDRLIIRRALEPASGASLPTLDFAGSEAFPPATTSLAISGAQPLEDVFVSNNFFSAGRTVARLYGVSRTGSSMTLTSIPAEQLAPGDVHELYVSAWGSNSEMRGHLSYFASPADREITFGPTVGTASTALLASAPYPLMRGRLAAQQEYPGGVKFIFGLLEGGSRNVHVAVTAGYLGGTPATWEVVVPDFTGVPGFSSSWMPSAGQVPYYQVDAYSGGVTFFSVLPLFHPRVDRTTIRFSARAGHAGGAQAAVAPSLSASRATAPRRRPSRPTGFLSRP